MFTQGYTALHLVDSSYVTVSNLRFEGNSNMGIYTVGETAGGFSQLSPSHHIIIENVAEHRSTPAGSPGR